MRFKSRTGEEDSSRTSNQHTPNLFFFFSSAVSNVSLGEINCGIALLERQILAGVIETVTVQLSNGDDLNGKEFLFFSTRAFVERAETL